jgi:hypothetical protein
MGWADKPPSKEELKKAPDANIAWDATPPSGSELDDGGVIGRAKKLFSPEAAKEIKAIEQARADEMDRQRATGTTLGQTELEHTGNALTFGYLPQIQAGVSHALTGEDYVTARDANIRRQEAQAQAHPINATAGDVAGTALNAYLVPLPTIGKGKGLISGALKGAQYGGLQGLIQNPGDMEGVVDPYQVDQRLDNAEEGAALGGKIGLAAGVGQKVGQFLEKAPSSLKKAGEQSAFKGSGAMLKDFRQAAPKGEVEKLGRYMLDNGLIAAGDTYETVAQKAKAANSMAGMNLDQVYSKAVEQAGKAAETMPGFNPVKDKAAVLAAVKKDLGDAAGAPKIVKKIESYLDQIAQEYGDKVLDPRVANDIKGFADKEINYARNPLNGKPKTEKAFSTLRKFMEQKVYAQVEHLGAAAGEKGLGDQLRKANADYSMSKRVGDIASDRVNRVGANKMFGLTDTIAGGAGMAAGGAAAAVLGDHNRADMGLMSVASGLLAAGGHHVAGKYGPAIAAQGLDRLSGSRPLQALSVAGGAGAGLLQSPGLVGRIGSAKAPKFVRAKDKNGQPVLVPLSDKDTP